MKKIITGALILSALFITGCSKTNTTRPFRLLPSRNSYIFDVKSSGEIENMTIRTWNSESKQIVSEINNLSLGRNNGQNYRETIENPARKIKSAEGKEMYDEEKDALISTGFVIYQYETFKDDVYPYMYELDCSENTKAIEEKINNFYIFSKTPLDVISSKSTADFIKNDGASHICIDKGTGTEIYLVTDAASTPNFCIIEKGEDSLSTRESYTQITVESENATLEPSGLLNIVTKKYN